MADIISEVSEEFRTNTLVMDGVNAKQLPVETPNSFFGFRIKASSTNAAVVWIAESEDVVNSTGYPLSAGEVVLLRVAEAKKIWFFGPNTAKFYLIAN